MFIRILAATVAVCLSNVAQGQADTSRRRPLRQPTVQPPVADSVRATAIDPVEAQRSEPIFGGMDSVARRRMVDTLEAQRRLWQQRRPHTYVIRVLRMDDCIDVRTRPRVAGRLLRDQLVVRDTTIVRRDLVPIPAALDQRCPLLWRVEDLFADLARALADPTARVAPVEYDAAYGFPRAYSVFHGGSSSGFGRVVVESFAPAP